MTLSGILRMEETFVEIQPRAMLLQILASFASFGYFWNFWQLPSTWENLAMKAVFGLLDN